MAGYVVMEPPVGAGQRGDGERAVLVRDGFHFIAFLLPALWLLFHRLWIEALVAVFVAVALGALGTYAGFGPASSILSLLVGIYVGLEGPALKLAALRRRGWREWGVVEAEKARDAEIRYLTQYAPADAGTPLPAQQPVLRPHVPVGPALGMLGYPGRG